MYPVVPVKTHNVPVTVDPVKTCNVPVSVNVQCVCVCVRGVLWVWVRFGMFLSIRSSRRKKRFSAGGRFFAKDDRITPAGGGVLGSVYQGFREVRFWVGVFEEISWENGLSPFGRVLEEISSKSGYFLARHRVCRGFLCVLVRSGMFSSSRFSRGKKIFFGGGVFFRKG